MEKYNLPHERTSRFEIYNGRNVDTMPKLISDGRIPMSVAQLMQRRIDLRNDKTGVKDFYMNNYFDTGDGVIYYPNEDVKIVRDSQTLREMGSQSQRNNGALVIGEEAYKAIEGEVFKKGKLGKTGNWMSKADVKAHPVWKVLAREQALLDDYADYIFTEGKKAFNYDTAMGVYPGLCGGNAPEMRAWCVGRLGNRSDANGWCDLDVDLGRFVGIAPEALSAQGKGITNPLEARVQTALGSKTAFKHNGTLYVPVAETSGIRL